MLRRIALTHGATPERHTSFTPLAGAPTGFLCESDRRLLHLGSRLVPLMSERTKHLLYLADCRCCG
jgi:hypothetical protein